MQLYYLSSLGWLQWLDYDKWKLELLQAIIGVLLYWLNFKFLSDAQLMKGVVLLRNGL